MLASASKLSLDYGGNPILDEVELEIADGQRIGVVGENGSGKSTLLKLLAGVESPTGGTIARARNLTVGYLPQETDPLEGGQTVFEAVAAGSPEVASLVGELHRLQARMADPEAAGKPYRLEQL